MRRLVRLLLTATLSTALLVGCGGKKSDPAPNDPKPSQGGEAKVLTIGLTQIAEHPALDATRNGVIDGLKAAGFEDGKQVKIDFQNAQGLPDVAKQIADKFVADKKDLVIAIATPSAQTAAKSTEGKGIPVVFSAVTDPVSAKLVASFEKPGGTITGVTDLSPVKEQLELFKQLGLSVTKVGLLYNSAETNSVFLVDFTKKVAKEMGLTIVEATAANASEVQQAAQSLVGRVDALYMITDNTLAQSAPSVIALAKEKKIPTLSAVESYVEQGALATLGFDYYQVGKQTGAMAAAVLKGKKPADLPVETPKDVNLIINTKTAQALGLTIPKEMLEKAKKIDQ